MCVAHLGWCNLSWLLVSDCRNGKMMKRPTIGKKICVKSNPIFRCSVLPSASGKTNRKVTFEDAVSKHSYDDDNDDVACNLFHFISSVIARTGFSSECVWTGIKQKWYCVETRTAVILMSVVGACWRIGWVQHAPPANFPEEIFVAVNFDKLCNRHQYCVRVKISGILYIITLTGNLIIIVGVCCANLLSLVV